MGLMLCPDQTFSRATLKQSYQASVWLVLFIVNWGGACQEALFVAVRPRSSLARAVISVGSFSALEFGLETICLLSSEKSVSCDNIVCFSFYAVFLPRY